MKRSIKDINQMTEKEFNEKYCKYCSSLICYGVTDKVMRRGCRHYLDEMKKESTVPEKQCTVSTDITKEIVTKISEREQKLNNLFEAIERIKNYWLNLGKNTEDTLNGFIHSLLVMFDGDSSANDFHHLLITDNEIVLNDDNYLHELWIGQCQENENSNK